MSPNPIVAQEKTDKRSLDSLIKEVRVFKVEASFLEKIAKRITVASYVPSQGTITRHFGQAFWQLQCTTCLRPWSTLGLSKRGGGMLVTFHPFHCRLSEIIAGQNSKPSLKTLLHLQFEEGALQNIIKQMISESLPPRFDFFLWLWHTQKDFHVWALTTIVVYQCCHHHDFLKFDCLSDLGGCCILSCLQWSFFSFLHVNSSSIKTRKCFMNAFERNNNRKSAARFTNVRPLFSICCVVQCKLLLQEFIIAVWDVFADVVWSNYWCGFVTFNKKWGCWLISNVMICLTDLLVSDNGKRLVWDQDLPALEWWLFTIRCFDLLWGGLQLHGPKTAKCLFFCGVSVSVGHV